MPNYLEYKSPSSFRSKFNPIVGIHSDYINIFNSDFLDPLFKQMAFILGIQPSSFEYLNIEELITEKEFKNLKNLELAKPYFYTILFDKIYKNQNFKIRNKVKFTFTYDKELTPIEKNGVRYGVMSLGSKPIFYYCYVDIEKVIKYIKALE